MPQVPHFAGSILWAMWDVQEDAVLFSCHCRLAEGKIGSEHTYKGIGFIGYAFAVAVNEYALSMEAGLSEYLQNSKMESACAAALKRRCVIIQGIVNSFAHEFYGVSPFPVVTFNLTISERSYFADERGDFYCVCSGISLVGAQVYFI
ncbi:MAG: hypothetical protein V8Q65_07000 [Bacteroidaceae bacterium]